MTNDQFLKTIFGDNQPFAHVTSFHDDPTNIDNDARGRCWGGGYYRNTLILENSNQYFTISIFNPDETGKARRRKNLFMATYVIVADDVREKLDIEQVKRLPVPTYKLETSAGSEQWGWVLDYPCTDRNMVENLLDGLVEKGLSPSGKDPGMKGVTRYVRLPEGVNTKALKLVNGLPVKCRMIEWSPWNKVSIENLAEPFGVDLHAQRRETRTDGASEIDDHPLVNIPDVIRIKDIRSAGRYDITCPWITDHTNEADDGAAVFTNNDGSIGFKCHHGSCEHRTGKDLMEYIEEHEPGFNDRLNKWKVFRDFGEPVKPVLDFMGTYPVNSQVIPAPEQPTISDLLSKLKSTPLTDPEAIRTAYLILQSVDSMDHGTRLNYWDEIRDHMQWSKQDLNIIIEQQRKQWYRKSEQDEDFYKEFVYVAEQNQFYNPSKRMWLTAEAFQNTHAHIDEQARTEALFTGKVTKVDRFDYLPGMPLTYSERGVDYVNGWKGDIEEGTPGSVSKWLNHFDTLGWSKEKNHILQWMAFTLLKPEHKINHILLLGGGEGNGKDFLLYPLIRAMGDDCAPIDGNEFLRDFNDYILGTKYLHVNEIELGNHRDAKTVTAKLKPLASCPPYHLRVNPKGIRPIKVRNIVNVSMTSNSAMPLRLSGDSRRYYAVWTDLTIRDHDGQVTPEWKKYFHDCWDWIRDKEGWKACIHYLRNHVDISDFNPGAVPTVTDFIKDIQEASEDPVVTVIKEFIDERLSYFQSDILTVKDIHSALKTIAVNNIAVDLKSIPNPNTVGKIMKQAGLGKHVRAWDSTNNLRLWIIRNHKLYDNMKGSELFNEYHRVMGIVKSASNLSVAR